MIAGATYTLPIDIGIELSDVAEVIVTLRSEKTGTKRVKRYPHDYDSYLMDDGRIGLRLSQRDTLMLVGRVIVEAQINLIAGSVAKTITAETVISDTLGTEFVPGAADNGENMLDGVALEIGEPIIPLAVTATDVNAVHYTPEKKTDEQKKQARENIDALGEDDLGAAVDDALRQAKESGEFDGEKGEPGEKGDPGEKGEPGDDYVLTEGDKTEIAEMAAGKLQPGIDELSEAIAEQQTEFEKVVDAVCDKTIIGGGNYNLLKISEVTLKSRLQDDSEEIISSNALNAVTGIIPVEFGKYYSFSWLIDGSRTTVRPGTTANGIIVRLNWIKADGSIVVMGRNFTNALSASKSTIGIPSSDISGVQIHFSSGTVDISTIDNLKALEPMFVAGDTAEEAYDNALTLSYMDGDEEVILEVEYSLKHDDTKANQTEVDALRKTVANFRPISTGDAYNSNFIPNERFIRGIANLRDSDNAKDFEITIANNSSEVIKNAAIAVGLHNTVGVTPANNNLPFQIYDDVFSAPTGFKFYDGATELPYYIESESDCNYIVDKNIKTDRKTMAVFSDGKIAVYNATAARMQISDDGGVSWTNICNNITSRPYRVLLPDSQDNLFVTSNDGRTLYKYTSADGYMTGTAVIDMAVVQESVGTDVEILIGSILAEDSDGNLYLGTYQTEWCCVVMKSADHGDTWAVVFSATDCQHVHNLYVNKKVTPNEIFLALDSYEPHAYVSTDAGTTWTKLDVPYKNREYAFRYAGENFYIGCGERNVLGGATLYKTTDYNDPNAYYPLFDNGQGIRDVTNVIVDSDDVLIAGGCVGDPVMTEQLFLSEDRGETWKTVLMRPHYTKQTIAGAGLRTFSRIAEQILSETSTGYAMRFVYGNGAKTTMAIVGVGDIPTEGKTITLKTGYVANVEQMDKVLTIYENIGGKVADIRICDGYVVDMVSNKRVLTSDTEISNTNTKLGQTSEHKILENHAYKLSGSVNLGKLSRLNFTKGFTVSMLFRKEDGKNYLEDNKYHVIFQTGDTKLVLHKRSICLMSGDTNIFKVGTASTSKLYVADEYLNSVNEDYIRLTAYFTDDDLPVASLYTGNNWIDEVACETYPITVNFSANDFVVGDSDDNPNIARIEIYNRVLTHGEIMSLTIGCNLVTDGSQYN